MRRLHHGRSILPVQTHLIDGCLADVEQAEQDAVQTEEDVIGTDRVDPLWVPLQKLLLQGKQPLFSSNRKLLLLESDQLCSCPGHSSRPADSTCCLQAFTRLPPPPHTHLSGTSLEEPVSTLTSSFSAIRCVYSVSVRKPFEFTCTKGTQNKAMLKTL